MNSVKGDLPRATPLIYYHNVVNTTCRFPLSHSNHSHHAFTKHNHPRRTHPPSTLHRLRSITPTSRYHMSPNQHSRLTPRPHKPHPHISRRLQTPSSRPPPNRNLRIPPRLRSSQHHRRSHRLHNQLRNIQDVGQARRKRRLRVILRNPTQDVEYLLAAPKLIRARAWEARSKGPTFAY
jgi:hypothetical protein